MKKEYIKPETDTVWMNPQEMVCVSGGHLDSKDEQEDLDAYSPFSDLW